MNNSRPWQHLEIPGGILAIPRMLSDEEARYLMWVTESQFRGFGAVVDLGPWLGGSSAALAEGLRRRGVSTPVHCFDLFEWRSVYMERNSPKGLKDGDDFMPVFLEETRGYAEHIVAERMDLMVGHWDRGPIEILFVDAAKSWDLWNAILRVFGPHLVPGRSRVIQQDFRHPWCHWLPLTLDSRPDVWREIESVEVGDTVTFVPKSDLVAARLTQADYTEADFDLPTSLRILERRIANAETTRQRLRFRVALAFKATLEGDHELAASVQKQALTEVSTLESQDLRSHFESELRRVRDTAISVLVLGALGEHESKDANFAVECLTRLAGLPQAHMVRGILEASQGDDSTAFLHLSAALDRDPTMTRAWFERAAVSSRRGDAQAVRDDVIAALASRPDHPMGVQAHAFRLLEHALRRLDSAAAAKAVIETLDPTWAGSAEWLVLRALIERETGDREASVRTIRRALELTPGHERAGALLSEWGGSQI